MELKKASLVCVGGAVGEVERTDFKKFLRSFCGESCLFCEQQLESKVEERKS